VSTVCGSNASRDKDSVKIIQKEKSMKLANKLRNLSKRKKGVTLVEAGLTMVAGILLLVGGVFAWGEVQFRLNKNALVADVIEINSAADSWKGFRSNYTGLTMTVLCAAGRQGVSETTCGGVGGNGTSTNPYGGNYTIAPGTNLSQKVITVTGLPPERITDLADTLAPQTAGRCASATGCTTLSATTNTITLTL
jgi:hypothetical protein